MEMVDLASRWLHMLSAITLLGGSIFSLAVLMPAAKELADPEHEKLRAGVLARWKRFVHGGIALLLITGLYNFVRAIPAHKGLPYYAAYHMVLGVKILLAVAVFFLASVLVGRSSAAVTMRKNAKTWVGLIVLLGVTIVLLSGYAKVVLPGKSTSATVPAGTP